MDSHLIPEHILRAICGGRTPHRSDFTAEMLPPVTDGGLPWRPLLRDEPAQPGDCLWLAREEWYPWERNHLPWENNAAEDWQYSRTRRPLPAPGKVVGREMFADEANDTIKEGDWYQFRLKESQTWSQPVQSALDDDEDEFAAGHVYRIVDAPAPQPVPPEGYQIYDGARNAQWLDKGLYYEDDEWRGANGNGPDGCWASNEPYPIAIPIPRPAVPLGPEDFTPRNVIRMIGTKGWNPIACVTDSGVNYLRGDKVDFVDYGTLASVFERSDQAAKDWLPCSKP